MLVFLNIIFIISSASTARILGYLPTPSYSHQVVYHPIWRELSLRGHSVTTLTTHPINDPRLTNLTEIDVSRSYQGNITLFLMNLDPLSPASNFRGYFELMMGDVLEAQLEYGPVKDLINDKNLKFDLVIVEYFFSTPLALTKRFDCPSIGVLSLDAWNGWYKMIGSPTHSILYPEYITSLVDRLSLLERVESFITSLIGEYYLIDYVKDIDDKLIQKHFGSNYPSSRELASNISLLFVNTDPIFHTLRPLVPTVIQIGAGSHITSSKPLPQVNSQVTP
ncbi:hypothetical protein RI129_012495 [Pyrocoelia pectoralis]|uniref:Uncharacterized protein n=1 Tax=Pyrocoelia pectoralis TaxID=417401 RepID=A0AAN7UTF7_9COLE